MITIGSRVRVTVNEPGFKGRSGEIVGKGREGYDWEVHFPDLSVMSEDTYFFNTDELEAVE